MENKNRVAIVASVLVLLVVACLEFYAATSSPTNLSKDINLLDLSKDINLLDNRADNAILKFSSVNEEVDTLDYLESDLNMPVNGSSVGQIAVWNGTNWIPSSFALLKEVPDYNLGIGDRVQGGFTESTPTGLRNTAFGTLSQGSLTSGSSNTAIGYVTLIKLTSGIRNNAFGDNAMHECTTCNESTALGEGSMYWITEGLRDIAVGHSALYNVHDGDDNIGIGDFAGFGIHGGDRNIVIGNSAGYRLPAESDDTLIIDNRRRVNHATEIISAIIYGIMADSPVDQYLRLNANVNVTQGLVVAGNINSTSGDICITGGNCLSDIGTNGEDGADGANWYDMTEDEYNCFVGSLILNPGIDIDGNYTSLQECLESLDD